MMGSVTVKGAVVVGDGSRHPTKGGLERVTGGFVVGDRTSAAFRLLSFDATTSRSYFCYGLSHFWNTICMQLSTVDLSVINYLSQQISSSQSTKLIRSHRQIPTISHAYKRSINNMSQSTFPNDYFDLAEYLQILNDILDETNTAANAIQDTLKNVCEAFSLASASGSVDIDLQRTLVSHAKQLIYDYQLVTLKTRAKIQTEKAIAKSLLNDPDIDGDFAVDLNAFVEAVEAMIPKTSGRGPTRC